ncbi:MAG: hypothetical protein LBP75_07495 [Planctomycetota bacterium]|nr:hypothetical protein [Planctomycetota bacterium]
MAIIRPAKRRVAARRNSPAQRKIGSMIFRRAGLALPENPPCKGSGNFLPCPYRARNLWAIFYPARCAGLLRSAPAGRLTEIVEQV